MIGRVAGYELLERIGGGGMGVVFKARDTELDRVVAVKILRDQFARDPDCRTRFLREAKVGASLKHDSIATSFYVGEAKLHPADLLEPGSPGPHPEQVQYLVMEYVPGCDLQELASGPPLEISRVLDIGIRICAGLESAHGADIIHRDLKSANIRVMPDDHIKIVDFGLSRMLKRPKDVSQWPTITVPGQLIGSVHFMSPEQASGHKVDARSDLFSLGVILYQLVTGRLPFTGDSEVAVLTSVVNDTPQPLARYASRVPDELQRIVSKLLEKDPQHRYQSAHEAGTDLDHLRHQPGRTPVPGPIPMPVRIAAAAVVLVAVGWLAWKILFHPEPGIAVMPFVNKTGDSRLDYLGDGMAANLIAALVRTAKFDVASLTAARAIRPDSLTVVAAARQLGVGSVVEGTLIREDGITYFDVTLTNGKDGFVRWTNRFPYALNDAADIEQRITREVLSRVGSWSPFPPRPVRTPRSSSAYDFCLRGSAALEDPDPQGAHKALENYARALDVDPEFALAWAGESQALLKIWNRDKNRESINRAEEAANHAIQLNPELLEARLARAMIYKATSRNGRAIAELKDVLKVNPSWTEALISIGACYRDSGDLKSALAITIKARDLQPGYWRNWNQAGGIYNRLAQYDSAAAAYRQVIRLYPAKNIGYENLAAVETKRGNYAAAMVAYQQMPLPVTTGAQASNMATAFYYQDRFDDARRYYELAVELEPRNYLWRWYLGDLHHRQGKRDSAQADYAQALSLIDDQLHVDPKNSMVKLDRALLTAKNEQCDVARAALADIASELSADNAEYTVRIAKLNAICGRRAEAIAALRRAVAQGAEPSYLRRQDEFKALEADPPYRVLVGIKS